SFSATVDGGAAFSFAQGSPTGAMTVAAGQHTVAELSLTGYVPLGWALGNGGACPASPTNTGAVAAIEVTASATVDVCFYNEAVAAAGGRIVVAKVVTNDASDTTAFSASVDGGAALDFAQGSPTGPQDVDAGTHTVTETSIAGYTVLGWAIGTSSASCPVGHATSGATASVDVKEGVTVVVCFYNEQLPKPGTLAVHKVVTNNGEDTTQFRATVDSGAPFGFGQGATATMSVDPGSHTVSELANDNYTVVGWALGSDGSCPVAATSSAGESSAMVSVTSGATTELCFYNTQVQEQESTGMITIVKQSNPPSTVSPSFTTTGAGMVNFSLVDDGTGVGNTRVFAGLTPGTYTVSENALSGWALGAITCGGGSVATDVAAGMATISLEAGESVTCTFVNNVVAGTPGATATPTGTTTATPTGTVTATPTGTTTTTPTATATTPTSTATATQSPTQATSVGGQQGTGGTGGQASAVAGVPAPPSTGSGVAAAGRGPLLFVAMGLAAMGVGLAYFGLRRRA
ncbi:MAG: hypothetical protein IT304_07895, partial [Dehalococcoidia bacterium]|nr:hypothetical protein [Dehalococcoidia bacterium]